MCTCIYTKYLFELNTSNPFGSSEHRPHPTTGPGHTFAMRLGEVFLRGWARGPCALAAVVQGALIPGAEAR